MRVFFLISLFSVIVGSDALLAFAETTPAAKFGEITVTLPAAQEIAVLPNAAFSLRLALLDDRENLLAQIEQLKEQSKAELEPLVKEYMYAAGVLTQLAAQSEAEPTARQTQAQRLKAFKTAEQQIAAVLAHYRTRIEARLQQNTLQTRTFSARTGNARFERVAPGQYRLLAALTFATTTLRWFEPILVKGGDRPTVRLTRANLMNPYWTDLNWWSFINLDFSKHH